MIEFGNIVNVEQKEVKEQKKIKKKLKFNPSLVEDIEYANMLALLMKISKNKRLRKALELLFMLEEARTLNVIAKKLDNNIFELISESSNEMNDVDFSKIVKELLK